MCREQSNNGSNIFVFIAVTRGLVFGCTKLDIHQGPLKYIIKYCHKIRILKDKVAERDATIEELQGEVRQLRLQNDALEQYGRRSSLRITGISEDREDTTKAVVDLANEVLELDPPLQEQDIDVSHCLKKPRNAPEGEPRPIIVRFMTITDWYRVISERKTLKNYNEDNRKKIYIDEDLTTYRARLFKTTRSLQAKKYFK